MRIFEEVLFFKATHTAKTTNSPIFCQADYCETGVQKISELYICFSIACSFEKEDLLENSHSVLFCLIKKRSNLLCVFGSFFQNAGSQLCFRFFS